MDIIYHYDGSFDGFLSCVFDSYAHREIPAGFYSGEDGVYSLFDSRTVPTDPGHAARVLRKVAALSPEAAVLLRRGFLTCLTEKELHLFHFTAKLLREGPGFLRNRSDNTLFPVIRAVQHLNGEVHLLKGFVRFSDLGGVLGGEIEPKNRVLPLLRGHFCARYLNEKFFLYDRTHREAFFYENFRWAILPVEEFSMGPAGEEERQWRRLWKKFFQTVSIEGRYNPKCQDTHLPKRYRHVMTEFMEEEPAADTAPALP